MHIGDFVGESPFEGANEGLISGYGVEEANNSKSPGRLAGDLKKQLFAMELSEQKNTTAPFQLVSRFCGK